MRVAGEMGVDRFEEKGRSYIRRARSRLGSASRKLHRNPCVHFALVAGAEAVYWSSFGLAGLAVCALVLFFAVLLLGPYLTFTLLLYQLSPWSKSSPNQGIGFLLFVGSYFLFFSGYRLLVKYPQLRDMENFSKIESTPVVFQIGLYYAFLSFCSLLGSLLTFDFLLASYWACFVIFYGFVLLSQMMTVIPWSILPLFAVLVSVFIVRLALRALVRHFVPTPAAVDHGDLRLRRSLTV